MRPVKLIDNWQRKKIKAAREHQKLAYESGVNELAVRDRDGHHVTLADGTRLVEFMTCSYLGLSQDPRIISAMTQHSATFGLALPAGRTRMHLERLDILEHLLHQIFCGGYATVFANIHTAILGFIPLISSGELPSYPIKENGSLFILDKTVHASVQINRALMEQLGEVVVLDVNDHTAVEQFFKRAYENQQTPIGMMDSVGSMGGVAPVLDIIHLAEKYEGYAYLDDVHATSVCGRHGCGYALKALNHRFHPRLILAASLIKAFGAGGGVIVVPTEADATMIKRFAPTYVFCGPPLAPAIEAAIRSAQIHLSDEIYHLQEKLMKNIQLFDRLVEGRITVINRNTDFPIRGILIGDEFTAVQSALELKKRGFAVVCAMYPTVGRGKSILRIGLSASHRKADLHALCKNINDIVK